MQRLQYANFQDGIFSSQTPDVDLPDDMDIPTFLFDYRPKDRYDPHKHNPVWFADPVSKREIKYKEARQLTDSIATALHHEFDIGKDDVVIIFSGNT
jgi:hypothetical protein